MTAQVNIQTVGNLGREVTVTISRADFIQQEKTKLNNLIKKVRMPGFRPGKAPRAMVEKQYKGSVRSELIDELINKHFKEAIKAHDLMPVAQPELKDFSFEEEDETKDVSFTVGFEVYPLVHLKPFADLQIEKPVVQVSDEEVDELLIAQSYYLATWAEKDGAAGPKDQVILHIAGDADAKPQTVGLWSSELQNLVRDRLVGATKGAQVQLPTRKGEMTFEVAEVQVATLPSMEELRSKFGNFQTVEDMRAFFKKHQQSQLEGQIEELLQERVLEKLMEVNTVEVPQTLVRAELKNIQHKKGNGAHHHDHDHSQCDHDHSHEPEDTAEDLEEATRRVTMGLYVNQVVHDRRLHLSNEELRHELQKQLIDLPYSQEDKERLVRDRKSGFVEHVQRVALLNKVVALILKEVQIIEKPLARKELEALFVE